MTWVQITMLHIFSNEQKNSKKGVASADAIVLVHAGWHAFVCDARKRLTNTSCTFHCTTCIIIHIVRFKCIIRFSSVLTLPHAKTPVNVEDLMLRLLYNIIIANVWCVSVLWYVIIIVNAIVLKCMQCWSTELHPFIHAKHLLEDEKKLCTQNMLNRCCVDLNNWYSQFSK